MQHKRPVTLTQSGAFTLIELLTVIAIIGILAAIIIPTVGNVRKSAKSAQAISNVKQVGLANLLFAQENKGQLLGEGSVWADTNNLWNNTARYLDRNPGNTDSDKTRLNAIIAGLVDPMVPESLQRYGASATDSFLTTWSVNTVFNFLNGKTLQGLPVQPVTTTNRWINRRSLSEFNEPSRIIYMVGGSYQFNTTFAADAALLAEPTARQRIWYYHGSGKKTPAVFLDGHTEMLAYPIDPARILPPS